MVGVFFGGGQILSILHEKKERLDETPTIFFV